MPVPFTKMHGAGNDFVVFDGVTRPVALTPGKIRRLADRHFGIGCDQVLLVERPTASGADFRYRIFNADGARSSSAATARAVSSASSATSGSRPRTRSRWKRFPA